MAEREKVPAARFQDLVESQKPVEALHAVATDKGQWCQRDMFNNHVHGSDVWMTAFFSQCSVRCKMIWRLLEFFVKQNTLTIQQLSLILINFPTLSN